MDYRERFIDSLLTIQSVLDEHQASIQTSLPGIVVSYDPVKMTAVVQPAIQSIVKQPDGSATFVTLPQVPDVPVHFPGGGGYLLTFPIKEGDECKITFASRCIDNWWQSGGVQPPFEFRMHDLSDAFCEVGIRSQTKLPTGGTNSDSVQLRSDDGTTVVEMAADGKVNIIAPGGVTITGELNVTGEITRGFGTLGSVTLGQHSHTQGSDTHGDGEQPTNAPTAGT